MKEGMPMSVTPAALIRPSAKQASSAKITATQPGSGTFAMFT